MSGRSPDPELPGWLALRRVHRGGVARMGSGYFDRGCPLPGYVGDALDQLSQAGLVALGEPEPSGFARASLTAAGQLRLTELSERLEANPAPRTGPAHQWVLSPTDHRNHVIDDGLVFTRCGQYLPSTVATSPIPGEVTCSLCTAIVASNLAQPPKFGGS